MHFPAYIGSTVVPSKRVDAAIEAISPLPDVHLAVAGDGPMRASIFAKAQQLLPGRFTSLNLSPAQMPDLYHSADIFLHMSLEEAFGNVFIEALASGLPIIAHDSPRLRWIVGDNALLLDTRKIDEITDRIAYFETPTALARKTFQLAATRFSWSKIALEYETFFRRVIIRRKNFALDCARSKLT